MTTPFPVRTSACLAALVLFALLGASSLAAASETVGEGRRLLAADEPSRTPTAAPARRPQAPSAPLDASGDPHGDADDTVDRIPAVALTPQIVFQILASEIAAQRGQSPSAVATYLSLAETTRDPRLARRAAELAIAARSLDGAVKATRLWRQLAPGSALAVQTLEAVLLSSGQFSEVEPLLAKRLARARAEGQLEAFYQRVGRALLRSTDPAAALAMFDRLSVADSAQPDARAAAALLASAAGDGTRAAEEAGRALALRPDDERTALLAARLAQASSAGLAEATRILDVFVSLHPQASEARFNLARLLSEAGRPDEARKHLERALRDAPDNPAVIFSLAQIAFQSKDLDASERHLKSYLDLPGEVRRDNELAYLFLAEIEEARGNRDKALEWLARVSSGDRRIPALARRAALLGKMGRLDEARALLQSADAGTQRERARLVLAEAQLLRQSRRYQDAFDVVDRALNASPDDAELLYDHAMAAERIDRIDTMESSLRRLIALQPDNAHAHNALGYSLADRNLRLDEAQTSIERALAIAPQDPHILDSMGWVLYRKGRLDEARLWLERALAIRSEPEIEVHLGEVLWMLGREREAREAWDRARAADPENEVLLETLLRLRITH